MATVTVAAIQFEPALADRERNLRQLALLVRDAARAGARLAVLPELATSGYCFRSRQEIAPLVEPVPGPTTAFFGQLAQEFGLYLAVGLPEVDPATGAYYNTAALLGPDGQLVGKYRKTHSFIDETRWARDGDLGIPVFPTAIGRLALLICMDLDYFETARVAAVQGADAILFLTNWLGSHRAWHVRAAENHLPVIAANRYGRERGAQFSGHSAVIGPAGETLGLLSSGDGVVTAPLDLAAHRLRRERLLALRRPDQYHDLLVHRYLWDPAEAQGLPAGGNPVVAAAQFQPGPDPGENLARMEQLARWVDRETRDRIGRPVDVVLFPEGAAMPAAGALAPVARDLHCCLCWGAPHGGCGSAVLVTPEGVAHRSWRLHPLPGEQAGTGHLVLDLPWGRVGVLPASDLDFPESARLLAGQGTDMLLAPGTAPGADRQALWAERAENNDTAVAVCTAGGGSLLAVPGAERAVELPAAGTGTGFVQLDLAAAGRLRRKEILRKRQPFWYLPLVRNP